MTSITFEMFTIQCITTLVWMVVCRRMISSANCLPIWPSCMWSAAIILSWVFWALDFWLALIQVTLPKRKWHRSYYYNQIFYWPGVWSSRDELQKLRRIERTFVPRTHEHEKSVAKLRLWERAVERFRGWYHPKDMEQLNQRASS